MAGTLLGLPRGATDPGGDRTRQIRDRLFREGEIQIIGMGETSPLSRVAVEEEIFRQGGCGEVCCVTRREFESLQTPRFSSPPSNPDSNGLRNEGQSFSLTHMKPHIQFHSRPISPTTVILAGCRAACASWLIAFP
jgi:hypothetical protein